jgi:hypothetical protein
VYRKNIPQNYTDFSLILPIFALKNEQQPSHRIPSPASFFPERRQNIDVGQFSAAESALENEFLLSEPSK